MTLLVPPGAMLVDGEHHLIRCHPAEDVLHRSSRSREENLSEQYSEPRLCLEFESAIIKVVYFAIDSLMFHVFPFNCLSKTCWKRCSVDGLPLDGGLVQELGSINQRFT